MKAKNYQDFIEQHVINSDYSRRGGSIKIDVSSLFPEVENAIMGAYQNYLGGGMLGAVVGGAGFDPAKLSKKNQKVFFELKDQIKRYFYTLTNKEASDYDEWAGSSYLKNQLRPVSAY